MPGPERGAGRPSEAERLLTEADCVALAEQVFGVQQGGGDALVRITSYWGGELRWGRNRVTLASDRRETMVEIRRRLQQAEGLVVTNQLDPAGLTAAVRAAERVARHEPTRPDHWRAPYLFAPALPTVAIWSDTTYALTAEARGQVARTLIEPAEAQGLLAAGHLAAEAQAHAVLTTKGHRLYARMSQAQCAMTVRDPEGTGSGWAGKSSYDWARLDGPALGARALQKCVASRHPVALEPGRYTVILEPQAVADLLSFVLGSFDRVEAEGQTPGSPWRLRPGFTKLGLKVADERVTIGQDPSDPQLGARPFWGVGLEPGDVSRAVNWIEKGVLTALPYNRPEYALPKLNENPGLVDNNTFRMAGGETSIDEMIATTKRGLLVTRFWGLDSQSVLLTGLTRDGLWLIEQGKITKPVKNLRFTESPLFLLNSLEQLGPAEPVFRPGYRADLQPAVVPPLKARDFNFTALVDAV